MTKMIGLGARVAHTARFLDVELRSHCNKIVDLSYIKHTLDRLSVNNRKKCVYGFRFVGCKRERTYVIEHSKVFP